MKTRGIFIISLFFLGGLIMGFDYQKFSWSILISILLIFLSLVGILFYIPKWRRKGVVFFLVFLSGFFYYCWFNAHNVSQLPVGQVSFKGIVEDNPKFDGDTIRILLLVTGINHNPITHEDVVVQIYVKSEEELKKGRKILQSGRELSGVMELKVPDSPTNPGEFNYQEYLYWKKIHRQGTIKDFSSLSLKKEMQWNLFSFLNHTQSYLSQKIDQLYNQETGGLIKGFLLGNNRELDPDVSLLFSHLGLSHILAISGQHITWLMVGLFAFFRAVGMYKERAYVLIMLILPLSFYDRGKPFCT